MAPCREADPGPVMRNVTKCVGAGPPLPTQALKELPQPHVVLAWGFLIAKPDPCRLST